jgi:hypothetical protein
MIQQRTSLIGLLALGILVATGVSFAASPATGLSSLAGRSDADAFLRAHAGEAYKDATLGDYRLLDLDNDGRTDLIATVDYSGRRFFNHLLVLHDDGERFTVQVVDAWNVESLNGTVQDLDGDGRVEILLRQSLTPYLGASPTAGWTAVFRFEGDQLVDQSARFPQFYDTRILPPIERELGAPGNDMAGPYRRDLLTLERDKVLRVLGREPAAGLDWALSLARSENPVRRIFALSVLAEVGGAEATAVLKALGEDRDPLVASHALVTIAVKGVGVATP